MLAVGLRFAHRFCVSGIARMRPHCTVPKKPILFCKSAVLSQKNKKNNFFQSSKSYRLQAFHKIGFFGTVQHFCKKRLVFLGQYSTFARKLTKTLYCPKKTILSQKNQKNQSFQVLGPRRATRLEKIVFFGFFGTVQHFCKKDCFFWDSTALLQEN